MGGFSVLLVGTVFSSACNALEPGTIVTVAGGGIGDGLPARYAFLDRPSDLCFDGEGNLYIADTGNHRIRRVGKDGIVTTVVGGEGSPLLSPTEVVVDPDGNLYIKDSEARRIWKVGSGGTLRSLAFTYVDGEGHELRSYWPFSLPLCLAVDGEGNLYLADMPVASFAARLWKVSPEGEVVWVTQLDVVPDCMVSDGDGHLFLAQTSRYCVWRMDLATGEMEVVAGTGVRRGEDEDIGAGRPATEVKLRAPSRLALDREGNLYIVDEGRVLKVDRRGLLYDAKFPFGTVAVGVSPSGEVYAISGGEVSVRTSSGKFVSVVGTSPGEFPDGVPATSVRLARPTGIAVDGEGQVYVVADKLYRIDEVGRIYTYNFGNIVKRISVTVGARTYVLEGPLRAGHRIIYDEGSGMLFFLGYIGAKPPMSFWRQDWYILRMAPGDTASVVADLLSSTYHLFRTTESDPGMGGLAVGPEGELLISDGKDMWRLDPEAGTFPSVRPWSLKLSDGERPWLDDIAVDPRGYVVASDPVHHRIVRFRPYSDEAEVVAGTGEPGFGGDGGPATEARLDRPSGLCLDFVGNIYIVDTGNGRVRKISTDGVITTVAGNGGRGYGGDGGPATEATLDLYPPFTPEGTPSYPYYTTDLVVDREGNLLFTDTGNGRIRMVVGVAPPATGVGEQAEPVPASPTLFQNFPNPFNGSTVVSYRMPSRGWVDISVYDLLGRRVRVLVDGPQEAGIHMVSWDRRDGEGRPVGSGVYLVHMNVGGFVRTCKAMVLR